MLPSFEYKEQVAGLFNAGMVLVPLNPFNKVPLISWGTESVSTLDEWVAGFPSWQSRLRGVVPNVAINTEASNLCVVDCDLAKPKSKSLEDWCSEHGKPVPVGVKDGVDYGFMLFEQAGLNMNSFVSQNVIVHSPSGGIHSYFQTDKPVKSTASVMGWNVDIKSRGGLITAPPSVRTDGAYSQYPGSRLLTRENITVLPDSLKILVTPEQKPVYKPSFNSYSMRTDGDTNPKSIEIRSRLLHNVATSVQPGRNNTLRGNAIGLFKSLREFGGDIDRWTMELKNAGLACGLGSREVNATVDRAYQDVLNGRD